MKQLNWRIINGLNWNDEKDGKRIKNCEFLIFPKIKVDYIDAITCFNTTTLLKITKIIEEEIKSMTAKAVSIYQKEGWLA